MTLEIMDFEEYQKKQKTRLQNPSPIDDKILKEHQEQDDVVCRGGWYTLPKKISCIDNIEKSKKLQNPLLLGVKMFLADEIYLINMKYDIYTRTCSEFARSYSNRCQ